MHQAVFTPAYVKSGGLGPHLVPKIRIRPRRMTLNVRAAGTATLPGNESHSGIGLVTALHAP